MLKIKTVDNLKQITAKRMELKVVVYKAGETNIFRSQGGGYPLKGEVVLLTTREPEGTILVKFCFLLWVITCESSVCENSAEYLRCVHSSV